MAVVEGLLAVTLLRPLPRLVLPVVLSKKSDVWPFLAITLRDMMMTLRETTQMRPTKEQLGK